MRRRDAARSAGFTVVELLVAMAVGGVVLGLTVGLVLSSRDVFYLDTARVSVNENLRSAATVIGADARQAGERLPAAFPAVIVTKGAGGGPDTLRLRRNLLDVTLPLCRSLRAGSAASAVFVSKRGNGGEAVNPDCRDDTTDLGLDAWERERVERGGVLDVYLWDPLARRGEFFRYGGVDASDQHLRRVGGRWTFDYDAAQFPPPMLFVLEERAYTLDRNANRLTVAVNDAPASPFAPNITDFRATAYTRDGTAGATAVPGDFPTSTLDWKALAFVRVEFDGRAARGNRRADRRLSYDFTPRNVFSADN